METRKRILIVDDEPKFGKIWGIKLNLAGFEVVTTTSGADAIELVKTQKFDIMLLDIMMPGISGMDVLDKVRSFSRIPVLIFTGRDDIFQIAKQAGANGYIPKNLNPDLLVQNIETILGKKD
jgi:DNA-binding response OmpR family regulator